VLFSPVHGVLPPQELARWLMDGGVPARLQLQAHKYIGGPEQRGV
jgi:7-carboxy-7-deazaguanine synthase